MKYLGIDVHSGAGVWCLRDQSGEQLERGRTPTYPALRELASRLGEDDDLLAGDRRPEQSTTDDRVPIDITSLPNDAPSPGACCVDEAPTYPTVHRGLWLRRVYPDDRQATRGRARTAHVL